MPELFVVAVVVAVTELPDVLVDCPDCAIPSVSDCCSTAKACCVAVFICSTAVSSDTVVPEGSDKLVDEAETMDDPVASATAFV